MSNENKPRIDRPQSPNNNDKSPNWGFYILMLLIIGILGYSFFGDGMSAFSTKKLTLSQFEDAYQKGLIVLNDPTNKPLSVITSDGTTQTSISGTIVDTDSKKPTGIEEKFVPFYCSLNNIVFTDKLKERLLAAGAHTNLATTLTIPQNEKALTAEQLTQYLDRAEITDKSDLDITIAQNDVGTNNILITGKYIERTWPNTAGTQYAPQVPFETLFNAGFERNRVYDMLKNTAEFKTKDEGLFRIFVQFLPVILILFILFFMFRSQMRSAGKTALNFGKSRAKLLDSDKRRVTFKDVAGLSEAKEDVWEIVDFLREPEKLQKLGGRIPKGVLMVGPPGTGKTLIARAIAGEANVPFFTISGSDFVEMFVGTGASRVRDMFEEAKKNSPCLIFIDEIDAVGRRRGQGMGGGNDEREQTLNALLVEMDGFEANQNVIVIAATNRPDVLDPALLRPGRFDRQVTVSLPNVREREDILKVHAKKVKMSESVDLSIIARATAGFSGAQLANLINEAALAAVRLGQDAIYQKDLEEARDKVGWGRERRSMAITDKEKENTAYHEAGHAICLLKCEHTEPLHKVTIIPRGPSLGSTMWLPTEDKFTSRKSEYLDSIVVAMGGRCAEEIIFKDVTSGAQGDIRMATETARRMVCQFGMSSNLGMVEYDEERYNYSGDSAKLIDDEVRRIIDEGYQRCLSILNENKNELEKLAKALLEYETLDGQQVKELLELGYMTNTQGDTLPPPIPHGEDDLPPAMPSQEVNTPSSEEAPTKEPTKDQMSPEVQGSNDSDSSLEK